MAFQDFLNKNGNTMMQLGLGLLSGKNSQEQAALGAQGLVSGIQTNRTTAWLKKTNPALAEAVENGVLTPGDAYKFHVAEEAAARKAKLPNRKFQTLPDGTFGWSDDTAGTWTPLGKAAKPSEQKDVYAERRAAAEANGLTPDHPAYQSYVLTGKMPREDQAPLTATDKKAILEADEMVQSNKTAINSLRSVLDDSNGTSLNDRAGSGSGAGWQAWAARNDPTGWFDDNKGEATTELNTVITGNTLGQLKAIFGGNPTEGERAVMRELEASMEKTPQERKLILNRAIELANARLEFNQQRADELRGGTFYKPGGGASGGGANVDDLLKKYGG